MIIIRTSYYHKTKGMMMMKQRRTKKEMNLMKYEVGYYLEMNDMDAEKAFDHMIEDILKTRQYLFLPYYIKGISDFEKLAKEINEKKFR